MSRREWTAVCSALLFGVAVAGNAGVAAALSTPNQFCTGDPCIISGSKTADPNITLNFGARAVILQGTLTMQPLGDNSIGSLTINARSFAITGPGQLRGNSSSAGGGEVTINATDTITINDTDGSGAVRLSGQDAGVLTLNTMTGGVTISGRLSMFGDGLPASGGSLEVQSATTITITGRIDLEGGLQGSGGDIDLLANSDVLMTGEVDMSGGDVGGGFLDITTSGSVTMGAIDMSGAGAGGDAGFVTIDAGGNVRFQSDFRGRGADNGEDCGDGADIDVTAVGDITIANEMDIRGRGLDCSGGSLALDGARVFLQGELMMSGTGPQGSGGDLDLLASSLLRINGDIELDGGDAGGDVLLVSDGDMELFGDIIAIGRSADAAGSPLIDIQAGKLTIAAVIDGSSGGSTFPGPPIFITACQLTANSGTVIRALGDTGSIAFEARDSLKLRGQYFAAPNGGISMRYSQKATPPDLAGASFSPAAMQTQDLTLMPCQVCQSSADCVDGDPCTDDVCNVVSCLNPVHDGLPCSDGDPCTIGDQCIADACVSGPLGTCNDADGDGKVDDSDECTTLDWTADPTTPPNQNPLHFAIAMKKLAAGPGKQRILMKGLFSVALSPGLPIDPSTNGLHIYIEDALGPVFDVSLPGGPGCGPKDGWATLGAGFHKTWRYTNQSDALPTACDTNSAHGVAGVKIKDKRVTSAGGLQFKVKAKNATLLRSPAPPFDRLQVSIALAAQPFPGVATDQAKVGQCAEALFTGSPIPNGPNAPTCRVKMKDGLIDGIVCKGK